MNTSEKPEHLNNLELEYHRVKVDFVKAVDSNASIESISGLAKQMVDLREKMIANGMVDPVAPSGFEFLPV